MGDLNRDKITCSSIYDKQYKGYNIYITINSMVRILTDSVDVREKRKTKDWD